VFPFFAVFADEVVVLSELWVDDESFRLSKGNARKSRPVWLRNTPDEMPALVKLEIIKQPHEAEAR
jgi:hypothetical protein